MKKLGTLFLSVMMLATLCFGLTAEAAEIVNLISNADMTKVDTNNFPVDFSLDGATTTTAVVADVTAVDQAAGVAGTKKLVVDKTTSAENVYITLLTSTAREMFVPGAEYTFSIKYKTNNVWTPTWSFSSDFNYDYTKAEDDTYLYFKDQNVSSSQNAWATFEETFTFPVGKAYMHLALRVPNGRTGDYEFADIKLMGQRRKKMDNILTGVDFTKLGENGLPAGISLGGVASGSASAASVVDVTNNSSGIVQDTKALKIYKDPAVTSSESAFYVFFSSAEERDDIIPGQEYTFSFKYKAASNFYALYDFSASPDTFDSSSHTEEWVNKTGTAWKTYTTTFVIPDDKPYLKLGLRMNRNMSGNYEIADIRLEGLKNPEESMLGAEVIQNGGFESAIGSEWSLQGNASVVTEETNHVLSVPAVTDSASTTFAVDTSKEKVYEVSVKVKSSVKDAAKIWFEDANGVIKNKAKKDFFFNRTVNYGYTFDSTGGAWKEIKLNYYPSDLLDTVRIVLGCNAADATLAFDDLSVKPTKNLFGNGDFEGVVATGKLVGEVEDEAEPTHNSSPNWNAPSSNILYESGYEGTSVKLLYTNSQEPFFTHLVRIEAGKTYKLSGMVNTTSSVYMPGADYVTNTSNGALFYLNQYNNPAYGYSTYPLSLSPQNTGSWCAFERYFTVPTTWDVDTNNDGVKETIDWPVQEAQFNFRFRQNKSNGNYYMMDNLVLTEVKEGAEFYKSDATKLTTVPKGETVNVYYNYFSQATESEDVTMMIALYEMIDEKPCLVKMEMAEGSASVQKPGFIRGAIDVPNEDKDYKISAFCLDSLTGMKAMGVKSTLD